MEIDELMDALGGRLLQLQISSRLSHRGGLMNRRETPIEERLNKILLCDPDKFGVLMGFKVKNYILMSSTVSH